MFSPKFQWFGWALKIPAPTKGLQMSALHYSTHLRTRVQVNTGTEGTKSNYFTVCKRVIKVLRF